MDQSEEVLIALRQIMRAASIQSKRLMQACGLSTPQILILKEIMQREEIATGVLSKAVSLSPATVTSILDRLSAKGLVQRIRSDVDRRKVLVRLTDAGKEQVRNLPGLLQEEFSTQFEKLESWEQTLILSSIQRIAQMMNAEHLPASPVLTAEELPS